MKRSLPLAAVGFTFLVLLPGCGANPKYDSVYDDLVSSRKRVIAAMSASRDTRTLKEASEVMLKESQIFSGLRNRMVEIGKPNSASKTAMKEKLEKILAMAGELEQASKTFTEAIKKSSLSKDEKQEIFRNGKKYDDEFEGFILCNRSPHRTQRGF